MATVPVALVRVFVDPGTTAHRPSPPTVSRRASPFPPPTLPLDFSKHPLVSCCQTIID